DFDLGPLLHEAAHLDESHRRIVAPDDDAIGLADLLPARQVFPLVGHIPVETDDMLGTGACFSENCDYVFESSSRLIDEIVALELLLGVPANLPADKDRGTRSDHAVGVAGCTLPTLRVQRPGAGRPLHLV